MNPMAVDFSTAVYEDRATGCLLGGAAGDALGRPNESRNPPNRRIIDFEPWHGWRQGPIGTITDDTQLTMALAESLVAKGSLNPDDFAARIAALEIRGIGKATRDFLSAYRANARDWRRASQPSSGNGAAMRAAPVGLVPYGDRASLRAMAAAQARVTHEDSMAMASSVAMAEAVAILSRMESRALRDLDARIAFLKVVAAAIEGMEDGKPYTTRKDDTPSSLTRRLGEELPAFLRGGASIAEIQDEFWSGAYVLESLPMAFACFLSDSECLEIAVVEAACQTRDADTVAAMTGNLAGAYLGLEAIPVRWLRELEYREKLLALARRLCHLGTGAEGTTSPGRM